MYPFLLRRPYKSTPIILLFNKFLAHLIKLYISETSNDCFAGNYYYYYSRFNKLNISSDYGYIYLKLHWHTDG